MALCLYSAHGRESGAELHGELVGEVAPVFVADLVLEPVQDLGEHILEVVLGVRPGGYRVAEEHEVGHHAARVDLDHLADAAERRVLLVVVADVAERRAPADGLGYCSRPRGLAPTPRRCDSHYCVVKAYVRNSARGRSVDRRCIYTRMLDRDSKPY